MKVNIDIILKGGVPLLVTLFGVALFLLALFKKMPFGWRWAFINGVANTIVGVFGVLLVFYGVYIFLKAKKS